MYHLFNYLHYIPLKSSMQTLALQSLVPQWEPELYAALPLTVVVIGIDDSYYWSGKENTTVVYS